MLSILYTFKYNLYEYAGGLHKNIDISLLIWFKKLIFNKSVFDNDYCTLQNHYNLHVLQSSMLHHNKQNSPPLVLQFIYSTNESFIHFMI